MTALGQAAFVLEAVALGLLLAAFFWIVRNLRALPNPPLAERVDRARLPSLCVVLPVRDEERDVEECVASILMQDYPGLEVVVVDDGSTDQTPGILARLAASDARLRVKRNDTLPPGWMGKNHALDVGASESSSEWVLFMDVDVRLEPDSLVRAVALAVEREADLFTIVPEIVTVSFWERVVMPFIINVILMVFPAKELNDPSHPAASGNGPFMLFRRVAYRAIGGHAAIKGEVIEDLVLAQAIKKAGRNLVYAQGVELARLRMYRSLPELWRGWSKNFHVSVGGNVVLAVLGAVALLAIFAAPWLLPIVGVFGWHWPVAEARWFGVSALGGAYVLAALTIRRLLKDTFKLDDSLAWLTPVAACITAAILVNSTLRAASGKGVSWKGRTYGTAGEGELGAVAESEASVERTTPLVRPAVYCPPTVNLTPEALSSLVLERCTALRDARLWMSEPTVRPRAWLSNFEPNERVAACALLEHFVYFAEPAIDLLFDAAFDRLGRTFLDRGSSSAAATAAFLTFLDRAVFTTVEGERPNPTDSGHIFCRKVRQRLGIPEDRILDPRAAHEHAQRGDPVIFVDDFVGTGDQFLHTWKGPRYGDAARLSFADVQEKSGFQAAYVCLVATQGGASRVRLNSLVKVIAAHELGPKFSLRGFTFSSRYPGDIGVRVEALLRRYAPLLTLEEYMRQHNFARLGYGELALALAFAHCVPDATIPLFWATAGPGWTPLVVRS